MKYRRQVEKEVVIDQNYINNIYSNLSEKVDMLDKLNK